MPPMGSHMPPLRPMPPALPKSSITRNATIPAPTPIAIEPARIQAPNPMTPPPIVDPSARPKMRDRMRPITGTTTKARISSV